MGSSCACRKSNSRILAVRASAMLSSPRVLVVRHRTVMLRVTSIAAFAAMTVTIAHAQHKRWAAVDANADIASPVAWGNTEAQARQRAIDACKKVAKTCSGEPATTPHLSDVFAHMCCTKPQYGCATVAAASPSEARKSIEDLFAAARYSNCSVRHYISAADGKELEEGTTPHKVNPRRGPRAQGGR